MFDEDMSDENDSSAIISGKSKIKRPVTTIVKSPVISSLQVSIEKQLRKTDIIAEDAAAEGDNPS